MMSNEVELMEMEAIDGGALNPELVDPVGENETNDTAIVISQFREVVASVMNEAQFTILSGKTPKSVIKHRPGKGGKTFSYVPHGYVTSTLNKALGFHWSFEILPNGNGERYQLIQGVETESYGKKVKTPTSIIVTGRLTCYIHDPNNIKEVIAVIVKDSTGEKEFLPGMTWGAHIKAAESDALKRCAARLGIANDLYWTDTDEVDGNGEVVDKNTVQVRELKKSGKTLPEIAKELNIPIRDVIRCLKE